MSRTTYGSAATIADNTVTRRYASGAVVGNYVTIRLVCRVAVGNAQATPLLVDRLILPMPFRVSQVCFDALGTTAVANLRLSYNDKAAARTDITAETVISTGTPKIITPGNLVQAARDVTDAFTLDLYATTDATGAIAAGTATAWVTGYFTDHITRTPLWTMRGQTRLTSRRAPIAGFYDVWPMQNERVNAAQAARTEQSLIAPYVARLEAISFDFRNLTTTTGTITADIQRAAVTVLSATVDADASNNASLLIDADSTPSLAAGNREIAKGDTLTLVLSSGAADSVPLAGVEALIWVWCEGHVRDRNVEPAVED